MFTKYVRYLGRAVCGQDMLLMDPKKIRAIDDMPEPRKDQMRQYAAARSTSAVSNKEATVKRVEQSPARELRQY